MLNQEAAIQQIKTQSIIESLKQLEMLRELTQNSNAHLYVNCDRVSTLENHI